MVGEAAHVKRGPVLGIARLHLGHSKGKVEKPTDQSILLAFRACVTRTAPTDRCRHSARENTDKMPVFLLAKGPRCNRC